MIRNAGGLRSVVNLSVLLRNKFYPDRGGICQE
ncbi:MAG: hypothetical protein HCAMLNBO_01079 [Candidatus Brocadia fulgida]|nr:hypothetical protein [Candidatus Brocadia fulgida]